MATLTRAWREKKKSSLIPVVLLYTVQGGTWFSAASFLLALWPMKTQAHIKVSQDKVALNFFQIPFCDIRYFCCYRNHTDPVTESGSLSVSKVSIGTEYDKPITRAKTASNRLTSIHQAFKGGKRRILGHRQHRTWVTG